ncbi:MAG: heavy-metal-associated domain-containing protein [Bacteroidales bacterium]
MKRFVLVIFLGVVSCCMSCNSNVSTEKLSDKVQLLELNVEGMTCEGCERTLETVLGKEKGVLSVHANVDSSLVRLKINNKADIHDIKQAVVNKGYSVKE